MHHHASGLVDDGEVVVFVDDVEREVFGFGAKSGGLGIAFDLDLFTAAELVACLGDGAVDGDLAVFDEQLHTAAADVREGLGEVGIDAHLCGGGFGDEAANAGFGFEVFEGVNLARHGLRRLQTFVAGLRRRLDLVARPGGVGDAQVGIGGVGESFLHQLRGVPQLFDSRCSGMTCAPSANSFSRSRASLTSVRILRYSARTDWRRFPLGSMFFDGISEPPVDGAGSEDEEAGSEDDGCECDPLDTSNRLCESGWLGLAENVEEKLDVPATIRARARMCPGSRWGGARRRRCRREQEGGCGGVDRYGVEAGAPVECGGCPRGAGGEAGVTA